MLETQQESIPSPTGTLEARQDPAMAAAAGIQKGCAVTAKQVRIPSAHSHSLAGASGLLNQAELEEKGIWLKSAPKSALEARPRWTRMEICMETRDYPGPETNGLTYLHSSFKPLSPHLCRPSLVFPLIL